MVVQKGVLMMENWIMLLRDQIVANLGLNGLMKMLKGPQEIETGYFGQIVVVVEAAQRIAWVAVFEQGTVVAGD